MCMRVEFTQAKNGFPDFTERSMKSSAALVNSSFTVSMRFVVRGPVFSMRCLPTGPKTGSTVGSTLSVAQQCNTPRGPNFCLNAGSFG